MDSGRFHCGDHYLPIPLDIVNWHYYPFQSERSPIHTRAALVGRIMHPASFGDFARYSQHLETPMDRHQPGAELWTGESGSAQCGGQTYLSDRRASSFWQADQLGQGARLGQHVIVRQSPIGDDYEMIDRLTMKPRPDFWISWPWPRLIGHTVKAKRPPSRKIRINGIKPAFRPGSVSLKDFPKADDTLLPAQSIGFWRVDGTAGNQEYGKPSEPESDNSSTGRQ